MSWYTTLGLRDARRPVPAHCDDLALAESLVHKRLQVVATPSTVDGQAAGLSVVRAADRASAGTVSRPRESWGRWWL
jgi:hypothetical protein